MKKILVLSLVLVAGQGFAAQMPMTQSQFFDVQAKITKDIKENPFGKEIEILKALDTIEALKGTEPWKARAKLWAAGARKQLEKAQFESLAKDIKPHGPQHDLLSAIANYWRGGDIANIEKALNRGANPNKREPDGSTPLIYLVMYADPGSITPKTVAPAVQLLINRGARVNERDLKGKTALMHAATVGSVSAITALLENGGDITLVDRNGQNAIHSAASSYSPGPMEYFLNYLKKIHREDLIDAQDKQGYTPLMLAVVYMAYNPYPEKMVQVIKLLIAAGANPLLENKFGEDAYIIALKRLSKHTKYEEEATKILLNYMNSWKQAQKIKTPVKVVGTHLPAGKKGFTPEAPLGGAPAAIVRQYLLGETEEEQGAGKGRG